MGCRKQWARLRDFGTYDIVYLQWLVQDCTYVYSNQIHHGHIQNTDVDLEVLIKKTFQDLLDSLGMQV